MADGNWPWPSSYDGSFDNWTNLSRRVISQLSFNNHTVIDSLKQSKHEHMGEICIYLITVQIWYRIDIMNQLYNDDFRKPKGKKIRIGIPVIDRRSVYVS